MAGYRVARTRQEGNKATRKTAGRSRKRRDSASELTGRLAAELAAQTPARQTKRSALMAKSGPAAKSHMATRCCVAVRCAPLLN